MNWRDVRLHVIGLIQGIVWTNSCFTASYIICIKVRKFHFKLLLKSSLLHMWTPGHSCTQKMNDHSLLFCSQCERKVDLIIKHLLQAGYQRVTPSCKLLITQSKSATNNADGYFFFLIHPRVCEQLVVKCVSESYSWTWEPRQDHNGSWTLVQCKPMNELLL